MWKILEWIRGLAPPPHAPFLMVVQDYGSGLVPAGLVRALF